MPICKIEDCDQKYYARGLCNKHYHQAYNRGEFKPLFPSICKIEGCNRKYHSKGYCQRHYMQIREHNKIFGPLKRLSNGELNHCKFLGSITEIELYDRRGNPKTITLIDTEDYKRVKNYRWCLDANGYVMTNNKLERTSIKLHRLILNIENSKFHTDHINHNPLDNRRVNLRICTCSENVRNQRRRRDNHSGYKGVSWDKDRQKWRAYINHCFKRTHLGLFENKIEAAKTYDTAAKELFGEFAYLNFPDQETNMNK